MALVAHKLLLVASVQAQLRKGRLKSCKCAAAASRIAPNASFGYRVLKVKRGSVEATRRASSPPTEFRGAG